MKNFRNLGNALVIGLTAMSATAAFADTPLGTTTSDAGLSTYDKIASKVDFRYWGAYHGGSLSDLGNASQPGYDGQINPNDGGLQNLENVVYTGYKIDKNWTAGVDNHFFINSTAFNGMSSAVPGYGPGFEYNNPSLYLTRANVINKDGFNLKLILFAQAPLTTCNNASNGNCDYISLPGNSYLTVLSPTYVMNYDFPNSRFSIGAYGYFAAYVPGTNNAGLRTFKIYAAPFGSYQIGSKTQITVWNDLVQFANGAPTGATNAWVDVEPGVNFDITPKFSVNPVLNIYPSNPTLASTSLQAIIVAKVF